MPFPDTAAFVQKPTALAAAMDDVVVIMNVDRGEYYELSPVAADIWNRLAAPQQFDALVAGLEDAYAADPGRIEADVRQLLEELVARELLEVR